MNEREMHDVMTYLFADFDVPVTREKRMVWLDQFKQVPYETGMLAAKLLVSRKSFGAPKAHDFHEALRELQAGKTASPERAWLIFKAFVQKCGRYNRDLAIKHLMEFDSSIGSAASALWDEYCDSKPNDHGAIRAHFWRIMESHRDQGRKAALGLLPGRQDIEVPKALPVEQPWNNAGSVLRALPIPNPTPKSES